MLLDLSGIKSKMVVEVKPHFWVNMADKENPYVFLEWLELCFADLSTIKFQANSDLKSLEMVDVDIDREKKLVLERFNGTIKIVSELGSKNDFWKPIINQIVSFTSNPTLEEIDYPGGLLLNCGKYAYLLNCSEEEGIHLERFVDE